MGILEVTFKIGLSNPLMHGYAASAPLMVTYKDTGNTVEIDPPGRLPATEAFGHFGSLDQLILRIRRECTASEAQNIGIAELSNFRILADAARAFYYLFESMRETDFRENSVVPGYPVTFAEDIQNNSLVTTCDLDWSYDGIQVAQGTRIGGGHLTISVSRR